MFLHVSGRNVTNVGFVGSGSLFLTGKLDHHVDAIGACVCLCLQVKMYSIAQSRAEIGLPPKKVQQIAADFIRGACVAAVVHQPRAYTCAMNMQLNAGRARLPLSSHREMETQVSKGASRRSYGSTFLFVFVSRRHVGCA